MEKLINLTPHPIVFENGRTLPKCENPPRLSETQIEDKPIDGIPVFSKVFDRSQCFLPAFESGVYLIVPLLIAQEFTERTDLVVTNDPIRDEQGRITGCRSLARV